jgi:hypothetical protein
MPCYQTAIFGGVTVARRAGAEYTVKRPHGGWIRSRNTATRGAAGDGVCMLATAGARPRTQLRQSVLRVVPVAF